MNLFKYQKEGVDFLAWRTHALLADEMGLGKTAQAIVAMKTCGAKSAIVLCPANVKYVWEREFKAWAPQYTTAVISGRTAKLPTVDVLIVNYDIVHSTEIIKELLSRGFAILICDEAHYLKNLTAKRTKAVYAKNALASRAKKVWMLTGTPVLNRPVELYPMLRRFIPEKLGKFADYMNYTKYFCGAYMGRFAWDVSGASHVDELSKLLNGFMLRRMKIDVLKDLPEVIHQKVEFDAPKSLSSALEVEKSGYESNNAELGSLASCRREIGLRKVEIVKEYLFNLLEEKEKLVIFAHHREVLENLSEQLCGFNPVIFYGGMSATTKRVVLDKFIKEKDCRVFLGNIEAAGTGIDGLQSVCDTVVFIELSWVPGQINQCIGRCHRIGQRNSVLAQYLILKGSIDEQVLSSVTRKSKVIKQIITKGEIDMPTEEKKHSIEENLERIATSLDVLVSLTRGTSTEVAKPATKKAQKAEPVQPVEEEINFGGDEPVNPGMKNAQELLAYCNKIIVPIKNKAVAGALVKAVMARIKTELNCPSIAALPADPAVLAKAKAIFDAEYAQTAVE